MSSTMGERLKISLFGESHGEGLGVVIDGLPAGEQIDFEELKKFQSRRAPGKDNTATPRKEGDEAEILSGMYNGFLTGAPLAALIRNTDTRSKDYLETARLLRPSHADYTAFLRYNGYSDPRGGGHFSARLTAPLVFAGGIALQILQKKGIYICARLKSVKDAIDNSSFTDQNSFNNIKEGAFPVLDSGKEREFREVIDAARANLDSVGAVVECVVFNFPAGLGDPVFGGIESKISSAVFGIPAVKGIEFGEGFEITKLLGSEANDAFTVKEGKIITQTNHSGGIQGGISNCMPIVFRTAFKPTPSIAQPQQTVDIATKQVAELSIKGRHDPCVAVRAVPVVEAVTALVMLDILLTGGGF